MSSAFVGNYTSSLYNASKRYRMKHQRSVPLSDVELVEIQDVSDTFVRQLVASNFPRGSSINNGFQVVQSGSPANNFTIKGGDGTITNPGVLFVDGYILFIKSDIEYTGQDATGALTDDDYTKTSIPALTTPGGARSDEIYVDFYFSEVSATAGSEYTDTSLIVSGIGSATANRVRQVQDIRVAEGGVTPSDGNDGNGIYHRYVKIATLARTATANIDTAMITDNRIKINSVNSLSQGTTITDVLTSSGQNIGNDTHRVGQLFMASTIDYKTNDLMFKNNGAERLRFTTGGNVGIGSTVPTKALVISDGTVNIAFEHTATGAELGTDSNHPVMIKTNALEAVRILANGKVGIGITNPTSTLHVLGDAIISNNLTVNGTTTTVNTEVTTTDMMTINQDDNQVALQVNQTVAGNTADVMQVTNAGTGAIATFVGIGTGTARVGIGTANPTYSLDVNGSVNIISSGLYRIATQAVLGMNGSNIIVGTSNAYSLQFDAGGSSRMVINTNGNVGIGTNNPTCPLHVNAADGGVTANLITFGLGGGGSASNIVSRFSTNGGASNNRHHILSTNYNYETSAKDMSGYGTAAISFFTGSDNATNGLEFHTGSTTDASPSVKMFLAQNGNVGIGTANPDAGQLQVSRNGNVSFCLENTANADLQASSMLFRHHSYTNCKIICRQTGTAGNADLEFVSNDTPRMNILHNGNVGIGTTNPNSLLEVNAVDGEGIIVRRSSTHNASVFMNAFGNSFFVGGNVGIGTKNPTLAKLQIENVAGSLGGIFIRNTGNNGGLKLYSGTYTTDGGTIQAVDYLGTTEGNLVLNPTGGNVGIGTANPDVGQLQVSRNGNVSFCLENIANADLQASSILFRHHSYTQCAIICRQKGTAGNADLEFVSNDALRMNILHNGNVGIGTTDPICKLDIEDTADTLVRIYGSGANSYAMIRLKNASGDTNIGQNGFAGQILTGAADGAFCLSCMTGKSIHICADSDQVASEGVTVSEVGNFGIGTQIFDSAAKCLAIANGTAPASPTANQVYFYSLSGEAYVLDSAGNQTKLSPHDEDGEWEYYSENKKTNKKVRIKMEKLCKFIDEKYGTNFVEELHGY